MATGENPQEVTFSITLNSDEAIEPKLVADTIRDAEALLSDLETRVRGTAEAQVQWSWADDRPIELTAHVNGVNREDLGRIVREAEKGFAALPQARGGDVPWPESYDKRAKRLTKKIVQRLGGVDSIGVRGESDDQILIEPARLSSGVVVTAKVAERKKLHASIEGTVDVVSVRGRLKASITELNTSRIVRVHLTDDLFETVKDVLKKRVVLEGMVSYREDGSPVSISDISVIRRRTASRPLDAFIGAAPDLTGGLDTDDYLDRIRGEDE